MKGRPAHHSDYSNVSQAILGFIHLARQHDLNVGLSESQEALQAAALGLLQERAQFSYALKSICCCSEEDTLVFNKIFDQFWKRRGTFIESRQRGKRVIKNEYKSPGTLVFMGKGQESVEDQEDARNVSGANRMARMRKTDFAKVQEIDKEYLEELALKLWKQMSLRIKKKRKNRSKGPIDLRATIRRNMSNGGHFIHLKRKGKKPEKNRLVILLDVSGSMDKYSFYLLRFVWALRSQFESIDAYVFSTTLLRITDLIKTNDLTTALAAMSSKVHNWSSGTQIGACLRTFNEQYAKRSLSGRSLVIVLSDGLDTGEPQLLAQQLSLMKRRTRRLIWLNPLKGMKGYEPSARGMNAALPEIDIFRSAHNLNSLLELENFLIHV